MLQYFKSIKDIERKIPNDLTSSNKNFLLYIMIVLVLIPVSVFLYFHKKKYKKLQNNPITESNKQQEQSTSQEQIISHQQSELQQRLNKEIEDIINDAEIAKNKTNDLLEDSSAIPEELEDVINLFTAANRKLQACKKQLRDINEKVKQNLITNLDYQIQHNTIMQSSKQIYQDYLNAQESLKKISNLKENI